MQFGYDENKIRTRPSFSGQKAICPLCKGALIGKCGDIYVWHWQHHHDSECDPWKEHETDWHRKWKENFPDNWQEVIIEKYGEKHIADVKTDNGFVIEFQNSFISTSTIRIREAFYEDMIWVVNAKPFKNNFILRSVVNSRLRNIESNASNELLSIKVSYDEELKTIQKDIDINERSTTDKFNAINRRKHNIETLIKVLNEFDKFSEDVIMKWSQDEFYWKPGTSEITNKIDSGIKNQLKGKVKEIIVLQTEIKSKENTLKSIEQLENFELENTIFKIVSYEEVNSKHYYKTKAISKASRATFFPEIVTFKTETEFQSYKYKKGDFDFAIDPSETVNSLLEKIEDNRKIIGSIEISLPLLKEEIKSLLLKELKFKIEVAEKETEKLKNDWDELIKKSSHLAKRQWRVITEKEKDISESTIEIVKKKNAQRFKIMKEKKGLYTFDWKHERKSWLAADNSIYFDIGEDYLFEKISEGEFKKIYISDFLTKYKL